MQHYLIGIDGGGTKTAGRLARWTPVGGDPMAPGAFVTLADDTVGASNLHSNEEAVVGERLQSLVRALCATAGIETNLVRGVCMGMAGGDRPRERGVLTDIVAPLVAPGAAIVTTSDALTALAGGLGRLDGIMVIAGTGSIALGARGLDRQERAGGWGHYLGDEGSGYMLALRALRAIARVHDGRLAGPTLLTERMLTAMELREPFEMISWISERRGDKATLAALSPIVLECAEAGDAAAAAIAVEEAEELALAAESVRRKLFDGEPTAELVSGGGNIVHNDYYRGLFCAALAAHSPAFRPVESRYDACHGALWIAASKLGTGLPKP